MRRGVKRCGKGRGGMVEREDQGDERIETIRRGTRKEGDVNRNTHLQDDI